MEYIYIIIFICVLFAEFSSKINTYGAAKQIALCLLAVGALVALSGHRSYFISIGVAVYLIHNIYSALRKNRRSTDHKHKAQ